MKDNEIDITLKEMIKCFILGFVCLFCSLSRLFKDIIVGAFYEI